MRTRERRLSVRTLLAITCLTATSDGKEKLAVARTSPGRSLAATLNKGVPNIEKEDTRDIGTNICAIEDCDGCDNCSPTEQIRIGLMRMPLDDYLKTRKDGVDTDEAYSDIPTNRELVSV